jgi:KDO2-lipid IV(A) lauroyltransferase
MRSVALLPYPLQMRFGKAVGSLMLRGMPYRSHVAETNLRLCFPDLSVTERRQLLLRHFQSLGMGLVETAMTWWSPDHLLTPLAHAQGFNHLEQAVEEGRGVLLLSAHFTSLELGCRLLALHDPLFRLRNPQHVTYKEGRNPLANAVMLKSRLRHAGAGRVISRRDVRALLKALREKAILWYAPDQDGGRRNSVFAPFFGVPCATLTATSRLAKVTGAPVVPFFTRRLSAERGYCLHILPKLNNFPGDVTSDAERINALIEAEIRKAPEQYLWIHRRFKTRPKDLPAFYKPKRRRRSQRRNSPGL